MNIFGTKPCLCCNTLIDCYGFVQPDYCSDECTFLSNFTPGYPFQCWEWKGRKDKLGYGGLRRDQSAYRFSYEYYNQLSRIKGLVIRHLCNNPGCVNPSHLAEGTHLENSNDARIAGTLAHLKGELNGGHKLIDPEVLDIYSSINDVEFLSTKYNVVVSQIRAIKCGMAWNHITGHPAWKKTHSHSKHRTKEQIIFDNSLKRPNSLGSNNPLSKLTDDQVLEIYKTKSKEACIQAAHYKVSSSTIKDIYDGRTWTQVTGAPKYVSSGKLHRNRKKKGA